MGKHQYTHCRACGRPYSKKEIAERAIAKAKNGRNSYLKRLANGTFTGQPRKANSNVISKMRSAGSKIAEIAASQGISKATVHRYLRETK